MSDITDTQQPFNAADRKQVRKRQDKAKREAERRAEDLRVLLDYPEFRRFIWTLICDRCQLFQSAFNPNGATQSLNLGRQDVGRELFAEVDRIDAQLIPQIMVEYAESQARLDDPEAQKPRRRS